MHDVAARTRDVRRVDEEDVAVLERRVQLGTDVLDLLVVCVEAGLGLSEAIKIVGTETELVEHRLGQAHSAGIANGYDRDFHGNVIIT